MESLISLSISRDVRHSPQPGHGRAGSGCDELRKETIRQARYGKRCYFCHLAFGESTEFELHHLDGDHANDSPDNVVPCCYLCHMPFHLDLILREHASDPGRLIYCPEINQERLNLLLMATGTSSAKDMSLQSGGASASSKGWGGQVYSKLLARADGMERAEGKLVRAGLSQVHAMVRLLQDAPADRYASRHEWLSGCLYLPPYALVLELCDSSRAPAFAQLDFGSWDHIAGAA
ncbi:hypothetical protein ACW0US_17875 [Xanthomonas euvesicatoria]